jgi:hypothetical protein
MTLSITILYIECHNAQYHFAECNNLFFVMLNVIMLSIIMLNVVARQ